MFGLDQPVVISNGEFGAWTPVVTFGVALGTAAASRLLDRLLPDKTGTAPTPKPLTVAEHLADRHKDDEEDA